MMLNLNYAALDTEGLWNMAYRLKRRNQSSSTDRIFMRLLRARVEFLSRTNNIVTINGDLANRHTKLFKRRRKNKKNKGKQ